MQKVTEKEVAERRASLLGYAKALGKAKVAQLEKELEFLTGRMSPGEIFVEITTTFEKRVRQELAAKQTADRAGTRNKCFDTQDNAYKGRSGLKRVMHPGATQRARENGKTARQLRNKADRAARNRELQKNVNGKK